MMILLLLFVLYCDGDRHVEKVRNEPQVIPKWCHKSGRSDYKNDNSSKIDSKIMVPRIEEK